jgi:polyhydroxyalkanoate synthesis regulator phasin
MMLDTTRAVVRKSLLAMLGAITLADDELEQLLDRLAARGEQAARERFNHIEALRNRLTGSEGAILEGALLRQTLQEEIERQGRLLAAALDLPTRDSINLLREQIEQISLAIDQIVTQHTPVIAPIDNGQTPAPTPAAAVPQPDAVEAPAAAVPQPDAVEAPAAAVPQPDAVEAPAAAVPQPDAVEAPAAAVPQPDAVEAPAAAVPQPDAVEAPAAAVPQPDAVEAPAAAVPQPDAVEAPAAAVPQPDAVEAPAAATAVTQPEVSEPSASTMTAPVAGYDALNAKQAAAIVAELEEADLLALYQYEQAHRNRITVLRAIEAALARHRGES